MRGGFFIYILSLFPAQQIFLQRIHKKCHAYNHDANDQKPNYCASIIAKIGVVLDVVAHSVACADHLGGRQQNEAHGKSLIAAEEDLVQRCRENDAQEHGRLIYIEDFRGIEYPAVHMKHTTHRAGEYRPEACKKDDKYRNAAETRQQRDTVGDIHNRRNRAEKLAQIAVFLLNEFLNCFLFYFIKFSHFFIFFKG